MDRFLKVAANEKDFDRTDDKEKENVEEPQNHVGKRRSKASLVWNHFKKCAGGQEAVCNHCSAKLKTKVIAELHQKMYHLGSKVKSECAKEAIKQISKRLPERFAAYEKRTIPKIATLIDPRFKKDGFLQSFNADEAAKALEQELSEKLSSISSNTHSTPPDLPKRARFEFLQSKIASKPSSNRADAIILLRQYLLKANADEDLNPLHFWKNTDEEIWKVMIKKHMCVPATSCESERMFSKAGQLISDRRCSLKPAVVDKLLFINRNMDLKFN
ncbi:uncharacterized protein LOC108101060 isoform X2 [Drosophila ficusphila]|uniref:uncharacterized protein LOC108101060 isoform X2 n=1 Tax=Drosophila ficusphila TaxID=30025 RepID=UPI0007E5CDE1|nr:uncharacterized protein LOC108101060 isoform X2 [Drosophila ficusphila]